MDVSVVGLEVIRAVPAKFLAGLAAGEYTLHGGVIRDLAGQIIGHLAMPASEFAMPAVASILGGPVAIAAQGVSTVSGLVANAQLVSLSRDVHQILGLAMAGTVTAGLGLATSIVGFWYLNRHLGKVENQVRGLRVAVDKLAKILETAEKARLQSAINTYKLACKNEKPDQREQLLLKARGDFDQLAYFYKGLAYSLNELAEIQAAEGFFTIACLGDAVCTSDLGMYSDASENLRNHFGDWRQIARGHCRTLLELDNPARLLEGRYVKDLPTVELTRLLDFANADRRGIEWMDVLRGSVGTIRWPQFSSLETEKIAFAKTLTARNDVLGNYVDHFELLSKLGAPVTEYSRQLMDKTRDGQAVINWLPGGQKEPELVPSAEEATL